MYLKLRRLEEITATSDIQKAKLMEVNKKVEELTANNEKLKTQNRRYFCMYVNVFIVCITPLKFHESLTRKLCRLEEITVTSDIQNTEVNKKVEELTACIELKNKEIEAQNRRYICT